MLHEIDTWQEDQTWYAAPSYSGSDAPVGEGETEEDAIIDLNLKIEELNDEWRFAWETRNDEP